MRIDEVSTKRITIGDIPREDYKAISVALDLLVHYRIINGYYISIAEKSGGK